MRARGAQCTAHASDIVRGSLPPHILNVDDNADGRELKTTILRKVGFQVSEADTGSAALQQISTATPDLLLLDLHLPDIDGFRVCRAVRENPALDWIPILLITAAYRDDADWARGLSEGADAYLRVPFDPDVLVEMVRALLRRAGRQRAHAAERDAALAAARQASDRLKDLIHAAPYGILRSNADGDPLEVNAALITMLGYPSIEAFLAEGHLSHLYRTSGVRERLSSRIIHTGQISDEEVEWRRQDGSFITVRIASRYLPDAREFQTFAEDVSLRKRLEDQLRQAQKMEAIGRLAGGIAHDFNNILTAITGYSEMVLEQIGPDKPIYQDLHEIRKASERAASLTRQLLAFGRRQVLRMAPVDINAAIEDLRRLLERTIGEDIAIHTHLAEDVRLIIADSTQLGQVLINLAANARDAMPEGGELRITTRNFQADHAFAADHFPMPPGAYVAVEVADTGSGMAADVRAHIFEPFFTTKAVGKGVGLGLATVYGIIKQLDGFVWVTSEPNQGTTFNIFFPAAPFDSRAEETRPETAVMAAVGTESILIVEDEPAVRALARSVLRRHGYKVYEAASGQEALALMTAMVDPPALLLTDLVMPGMSGADVARQLTARHPDLRVIYMSGYSEDAVAHRALLSREMDLLEKPFSPKALLTRVRLRLDRK
jgi:signal transduction histidine kinase